MTCNGAEHDVIFDDFGTLVVGCYLDTRKSSEQYYPEKHYPEHYYPKPESEACTRCRSNVIQKSISLKYEPASEPLHVYVQ